MNSEKKGSRQNLPSSSKKEKNNPHPFEKDVGTSAMLRQRVEAQSGNNQVITQRATETQKEVLNESKIDSDLNAEINKIQNEDTEILNFISNIKLPKSVLGQNLFPRKYRALFLFNPKENGDIDIKFKSLTPVSENLEYLDDIVQTAFLKKLQTVNLDDFKNFLLQHKEEDAAIVDVILEFKEN